MGIDRVGGDVRGDVRALPFRTGSFAYEYASHILEHLPPESLLPCLAEWARVLMPGGLLWVRVPNLTWACHRVCTVGLDGIGLSLLYGPGWDDSTWQLHRTGFTLASIATLVAQVSEWELVGLEAQGNSIWPGEPMGEGQEIHLFLRKRRQEQAKSYPVDGK